LSLSAGIDRAGAVPEMRRRAAEGSGGTLMETIAVTVLVPTSIRRMMADALNAPATMTDRDVQQYVAGVLMAALSVMGRTGREVARDMRVLNEDEQPRA
jgi:hypothetical protein